MNNTKIIIYLKLALSSQKTIYYANDWAIETMKNARYPLELFQRVVTVSLETMKIVNALPRLDI
ncbi:hypothetical protein CRENPOLYSF2_1180018 [Crenothrix polyspora]|uniref:Uncharacterized protein n=1 Tax=Crenothrix polyspora TaxID=360316 RepID=A0A1R4H0W4_9GAMM|nr:hypothetical protein CRENPOLYSF2_1180018 [Crenothrix polyspora]